MNYQRISTYEKDYEAASSFDLGSSFTTSKCLNACHTISLARSMNGRDVEDACEVMTKTIGIENEMALVLAYLATPDVFTHSTDSITKRYGWDKEKVEQVLFELHKQDLINQLPELESIFLSNKAITMLQNDMSIEYINNKELIEILRGNAESDEDDLVIKAIDDSENVIDRVKEYIKKYPNSRMGRFYKDNNMPELEDGEFDQFISLCVHFVLNFTNGVKANRNNPAVKKMINNGWAILFSGQGDNESDLIKHNNMILSVGVCKKLFGGMTEIIDYSSIIAQTRLLKWEDIEEKTLFYNEEETDKIKLLYQVAEEKEYQRIAEELKKNHLKVAVSGILHGGPGTGKTELAKQIARTTKRNLLLADASKLTGSYVGESERNYRDLFRNFRYIEAISPRAPILFIDEADGILCKRHSGDGSSRDRYANVVQNIILEELNDFEGILLATTNLAVNLDDAMDRRFLVKIKFHAPNENTRKKIWKSKLPQVSDEDINRVAREFSFSGGHIDNVVTKVLIESILNKSNTIDIETIIKYSSDENNFTKKEFLKRIGF